MNEADWLICSNPRLMLRFIRKNSDENIDCSWFAPHDGPQLPRKWRLFLATYCNRVSPLLSRKARLLVEFANAYVDEAPDKKAVERVKHWFSGRWCTKQDVRLLWGL